MCLGSAMRPLPSIRWPDALAFPTVRGSAATVLVNAGRRDRVTGSLGIY